MIESSLIIDLQYFGNTNYYKIIVNWSYVILDQYQEHKKKSFTNRTVIAGANGPITLSVPLEKGRSQHTQSIDVRISNAENWQLRHWRSIISSYNNSPWFKYVSDDLSGIFLKKFEWLVDWNLACLDWTYKILKLPANYELASNVQEYSPEVEDGRNNIVPGGNQPVGNIRYSQVFEDKFGFLPDLSILDLIFCEGPKSAASLLINEG